VKGGRGLLRLADDVEFHGLTYRLTGLGGDVAMLAVGGKSPVAIKLGSLFADASFKILDPHRYCAGSPDH
jgi:hypothetical protein